MNDLFFRMLALGGLNLCLFAGTYFYGRRYHPDLSLWLSLAGFIFITALCFFSITWIGMSVILSIVYLRILRKPNQRKDFMEFFKTNEIYSTRNYSQAALDVLGDKKWRFSEGKITGISGKPIPYSFWQGSTSSMVSSGQYVRTTSITWYICFIFPPGSVSKLFRQHALLAADKSKYSWKEKIRYFFKYDLEKPNLVTTAADGSFIIQYYTDMDISHYRRRLDWIRYNITEHYYPVAGKAFSDN
jgi:hypothetical protein